MVFDDCLELLPTKNLNLECIILPNYTIFIEHLSQLTTLTLVKNDSANDRQ
jgi:hypothetical protein